VQAACRKAPASEVPSGLFLVGAATVTDTAISGRREVGGWTNLPVGISMSGGSTVRRTTVVRTTTGLQVGGTGNRVAGSAVNDSVSFGILVYGTANTVRGNTIDASGYAGLYLNPSSSGNVLRDNVVSSTAGTDCVDTTGNVIPAGVSDPIDNTWIGNTSATGSDTPNGICPLPL
jgi:parallel beta-helix repeat protein